MTYSDSTSPGPGEVLGVEWDGKTYDGFDPLLRYYTIYQYRFPRTKRKRVRKKWAKRLLNWRRKP